MSNNFKFEIKEIADLKEVIKCVKESGKKIVILSGTLGSGKTTFVKEFVKSLGIEEEVNSPTFSIQNSYGGKVFHYDLITKMRIPFYLLLFLRSWRMMGIIL